MQHNIQCYMLYSIQYTHPVRLYIHVAVLLNAGVSDAASKLQSLRAKGLPRRTSSGGVSYSDEPMTKSHSSSDSDDSDYGSAAKVGLGLTRVKRARVTECHLCIPYLLNPP